ncbi:MAG TPA: hypothetical protein EYQ82_08965 [Dehalococcoidia bacterium]|jgi:hypothetical protein|nr:hypothetical protein [Dehalococcoidia bacterium]
MSRKVIFAGSFAGVAALAMGIAAYKALTESTEPGPATSSPEEVQTSIGLIEDRPVSSLAS